MEKKTLRNTVINLLKENWLSNTQLVLLTRHNSAERTAREIRKNPPDGYCMESRPKDCRTKCLEFRLKRVENV